MNLKIALVLGALLVLIIGVSCSTAIDFNHNDAQHIKHSGIAFKVKSNSSFEKTATVAHKSVETTKTVKKVTKSKRVAAPKHSQKIKSKKPVANDSLKSHDKTDNGWNAEDHEVSREDLGDGMQRISYDDGYHRTIDKDGNIINYGY